MIAPMAVGEKTLTPLIGPFHRPPQEARGQQQAGILRVAARLHPKRAADIAGQHMDFIHRDAHRVLQRIAQAEHPLAADMERVAAGFAVVFANRTARLHRADHDAAVAQGESRDMGGAGKCGGGFFAIAVMEAERDIAINAGMEKRRAAFGRGGHGGDGG